MKIIIKQTEQQVAEYAYQLFKTAVVDREYKVFGLTAGRTPVEFYANLALGYKKGELDFSDISTFNVTEYIGMAPDHPQSHRLFMEANLFGHLNIKPSNIHFLDGLADCPEEECSFFEEEMENLGGIKLQILGLGKSGELGFNAPGTAMESRTHYVTLPSKRRSWGLTMGLGTILDAQDLMVLATGQEKAQAVQAVVEGPVCQCCPASFLQVHPSVTLILDQAAAKNLTRKAIWTQETDDYDAMLDCITRARHQAGLD